MKTTFTLKQKLLHSSQHSWWKFANSCNFLKLMTNNLFVVIFLFSLALIPTRSFAQITTGFELDGNAIADVPNPPDDWDLIYNGTYHGQVTTGIVSDMPSDADNRFTVGSKDQGDINTWHYDIASVPDKDDVNHAGAALYGNSSIYFFGDRISTSGDAQIGFWLFKNAVSTNADGTFSGTHAIGDILLLSNFVNGGGVPVIVAYEWVGSGGSDGSLNMVPVSGVNLFAITNASTTAAPWPFTPKSGTAGTFPAGAFFEGGINFAGLGFGINPCFTSFLIETRSSAAINAELKDFLFGNFFTKPQVTVNSATICIGSSAVLTATVTGGAQPPTYLWSNAAVTPSISVSPSVTTVYTVVVTAENGCVAEPATGTVTVGQLPACSIGTVNPPLAEVKCKLDASATGYTNTISTITNLDLNVYTLSWSVTPSQVGMTGWNIISNGTNTLTFQSGLCGSAGANIVVALTVTNKNTGCVSTCQQTITPTSPQCGISPNPHGSLDCNRRQDTLSAILNVDNPTILWTASAGGHIVGSVNTATAIVDQPGTYTITANDAVSGCNVSATFTVTQDITVPSLTLTPTNVTCNGLANGSINLSLSGGKAPFTYLWSNTATTEDISGLAAGNYSVIVTGANGCTVTANASITQPDVLSASNTKVDVLCFGGNTGSIDLSVSGGTSPYTYAWSNGATTQDISGLVAGTYTVLVTDSHSCTTTSSATINQPADALSASSTKVDVLCNGGNNGSIDLTVSGGTSPYTYAWSNGATTQDISGLVAGTYSVVVTDSHSCTTTATATISQATDLVASIAGKVDVLCNGGNNGSIDLSVSGGTSPYTYLWSNGAITQDISGLVAGTYSVVVTDSHSCTATASATINQPTELVSSIAGKVDVLCHGGNNGSIDLSVSGGTSPYTYLWSNGATTQDISGLVAGNYSVVVTDSHSCTATASATIDQPTELVSSIANKVDVLCFGGNNGSIDLSVSGGTLPYTYAWSNGATTQDLSGLVAGTYSVIVTDAHSCTTTASTTINQPPVVSCLLTAPDPLPVCGSTGNPLTASVSNAVSYVWSVSGGTGWAITAGQGTPSIIYSAGQDSALFKLVVTNSNGCKDSCQVIVKIGTCVKVKVFCSLTQGFYGQSNGVACATGERASVLIPRLLGAPFGDLVIGKPGHSLTITQAKASCLILRMPSGGPAAILPAIDQSFGTNCVTTIPVNSQGRFTNTLLGQTIALGLNMRLDIDLGALLIPGTTFTTLGGKPGVDGMCGTDDDVIDYSSVIVKTIPQSVLTALNSLYSSPTIANLFDLANRGLGGLSTGGATLRDLIAATSAINEGFDGCRFLQVNSVSLVKGVLIADHSSDILMKAFPNPFANSTTIEFMPKTDGNVTLNVYTLSGVRVAELFNGQLKADESKQVIFNGTNLPNGIYIYKITLDDKVYFDKLILQK